jgi:hypothetical protein
MTEIALAGVLLISLGLNVAAVWLLREALRYGERSEARAHDLAGATVVRVAEAVSEAIAPKPQPDPMDWEVQRLEADRAMGADPTETWLPDTQPNSRVGDGHGMIPTGDEPTQPIDPTSPWPVAGPGRPNLAGEEYE